MPYSAEITRRAQQQLAQRKADHESKYNQQLFQAYATVPRLRQIDLELRRTMTMAAQAAFIKGEDAKEAMERVKQANLTLQQERAQLVQTHFGPGYLDEKPLCPHCGGSGYIGANMCSCLAALCRQEQKKELARLTTGQERFDSFRLDYYPVQVDPTFGASPRKLMELVLQACKRYTEGFDGSGQNLLFMGGTGLGKTFLSACIANELADKGFSISYESAPQLFEKLSKNQFSPDEQSREGAADLAGCDLLIVDDLGTELTTNFTVAALYGLINDRLLSGKSMLISTNLNTEELAHRYSPQIASRLQGNFKNLVFAGDDIRVLKNRGL